MRSETFYDYTIYEDGTIINKHGREIKKRINNGRYEVKLLTDKGRQNFIVSRLIYYVFNPFDMTDKNICISYKDGNKLNIDLSNLYITHRKDLIQGEKHKKRSILTDEQIKEIREAYKGEPSRNQYNKNSPSLNDLAKKYNVTKANIKAIVAGRSRDESKYKLK